jgi:hypothetical protein
VYDLAGSSRAVLRRKHRPQVSPDYGAPFLGDMGSILTSSNFTQNCHNEYQYLTNQCVKLGLKNNFGFISSEAIFASAVLVASFAEGIRSQNLQRKTNTKYSFLIHFFETNAECAKEVRCLNGRPARKRWSAVLSQQLETNPVSS